MRLLREEAAIRWKASLLPRCRRGFAAAKILGTPSLFESSHQRQDNGHPTFLTKIRLALGMNRAGKMVSAIVNILGTRSCSCPLDLFNRYEKLQTASAARQ